MIKSESEIGNFPDQEIFAPFSIQLSPTEKTRLLMATAHNCDCRYKDEVLVSICPAHSMLRDKKLLEGLTFEEQHMADRLLATEFRLPDTQH